jgi:hypothetical protein
VILLQHVAEDMDTWEDFVKMVGFPCVTEEIDNTEHYSFYRSTARFLLK